MLAAQFRQCTTRTERPALHDTSSTGHGPHGVYRLPKFALIALSIVRKTPLRFTLQTVWLAGSITAASPLQLPFRAVLVKFHLLGSTCTASMLRVSC